MGNRLTIRHLTKQYFVPGDHPFPEQMRVRLDHLLDSKMQPVLRSQMQSLTERDADGVWLIRRLTTDITCDIGAWGDDELAIQFASGLSASINQMLLHGADGRSVLYFPSSAHLTAQYVLARAGGRADNVWYYRAFEGLRHLTASQAIREAMVREQDAAEIVGVLVRERALETILQVLGEPDILRVWTASLSDSEGGIALPVLLRSKIWHVCRFTLSCTS